MDGSVWTMQKSKGSDTSAPAMPEVAVDMPPEEGNDPPTHQAIEPGGGRPPSWMVNKPVEKLTNGETGLTSPAELLMREQAQSDREESRLGGADVETLEKILQEAPQEDRPMEAEKEGDSDSTLEEVWPQGEAWSSIWDATPKLVLGAQGLWPLEPFLGQHKQKDCWAVPLCLSLS